MKELKRIQDKVETTLREKPYTRGDDNRLYVEMLYDMDKSLIFKPFWEVMLDKNMPKFFTVSRTRRKLQSEYPELRPTEETINKRYEYWKKFRRYAQE